MKVLYLQLSHRAQRLIYLHYPVCEAVFKSSRNAEIRTSVVLYRRSIWFFGGVAVTHRLPRLSLISLPQLPLQPSLFIHNTNRPWKPQSRRGSDRLRLQLRTKLRMIINRHGKDFVHVFDGMNQVPAKKKSASSSNSTS